MSSQFNQYAEFYNLLYREKNYIDEAEYITKIIKKLLAPKSSPVTLLDLACGTGKHIFHLEKMGFLVEGSDISSNMITVARESAKSNGSKAAFYNYSFQDSHKIEKKYDVVISMFSAMDYLTSMDDFLRTLKNISNLLTEDGIFIFDYWNGNAVTRHYDPVKVIRKSDSNGELLRISETNLDIVQQIATVKFSCMYFVDGKRIHDFTELHPMRYYFFQEMYNILNSNGFDVVYTSPFMKFDGPIDPYEWNISVGLKKKGK
ncbi:MAG: class I SAM-dependent methyltransferase [Bacteroidota bacterium]|nr:class I SAM-dependent methyltransferase [Bacteroidota bacterium]